MTGMFVSFKSHPKFCSMSPGTAPSSFFRRRNYLADVHLFKCVWKKRCINALSCRSLSAKEPEHKEAHGQCVCARARVCVCV